MGIITWCKMNCILILLVIFLFVQLVLARPPSQDDSSSSPAGRFVPEIDKNVSKTCKLQINDSVLQNILQLTHESTTQVVELAVLIYSRNGTRMSQELKWAWANKVGGTIISLITQMSSSRPYYFYTLSAGVKNVKVAISELDNYHGCLPTEENGTNLVFNFLLHQLFEKQGDNDYKLCLTPSNEDKGTYKCCSISGNFILCADYSSVILQFAQRYIIVVIIIFSFIALPLMLSYMRSSANEREHYTISDSPMALSSIFRTVLIDEKGPVRSAHRRFAFSLTVTGILYLSEFDSHWYVISLVWIIPFTAFNTFVTDWQSSNVLSEISNELLGTNGMTAIYTIVLTLPFNLKHWWNHVYWRKFEQNWNYQQIGNNQIHIWPIRKKIYHFFGDMLSMFVIVCNFVVTWFFVCIFLIYAPIMTCLLPSLIHFFEIIPPILFFGYFVIALVTVSLVLIVRSLISLLTIAFLLITGMYLNGEYYCPVVAPTMILVVYCWKFWRLYVETQYLHLKTKIYEICEELASENSVSTNDTHSPDVEENNRFSVNVKSGTVSKALYEELRETYLPYNEVFFWFFVRLFFVANFCLFMYVMILFFQLSGISGTLQIISTMAVGTLPFIFDAIWTEHTLEQKKVADMKLKLLLKQVIKFKRQVGNVIEVGVQFESEKKNFDLLDYINISFRPT